MDAFEVLDHRTRIARVQLDGLTVGLLLECPPLGEGQCIELLIQLSRAAATAGEDSQLTPCAVKCANPPQTITSGISWYFISYLS
jgi:hypothetical protein